jgi:hypothetical protein
VREEEGQVARRGADIAASSNAILVLRFGAVSLQ